MNTTLPLAALATSAHSRLSDKYGFIPTHEIVSAFEREDWVMTSASATRVRKPELEGFQRHLLRFAHRSQLELGRTERIETVLVNSHDGTSSVQLAAGVFRFACANGIIVADSTVAGIRLGHHRLTIGRVLESAHQILGRADDLSHVVSAWKSTHVTEEQCLALASDAVTLRWGNLDTAPVTPRDIAFGERRSEDIGHDLWTVFNRVQENVLRAGLPATRLRSNGRRFRAPSGIKALSETVRLNKGIWESASQIALLA